jgi:hypothetical protein
MMTTYSFMKALTKEDVLLIVTRIIISCIYNYLKSRVAFFTNLWHLLICLRQFTTFIDVFLRQPHAWHLPLWNRSTIYAKIHIHLCCAVLVHVLRLNLPEPELAHDCTVRFSLSNLGPIRRYETDRWFMLFWFTFYAEIYLSQNPCTIWRARFSRRNLRAPFAVTK